MKRRVHHADKLGELNIVPYLDIMVNLTMFMLVSMTGVIQFSVLNVAAPSYGPASSAQTQQDKKKPDLLLTVAVSSKGFFVAGSGGVLGLKAGEEPPDPKTAPPTIPLKGDGSYDYETLTRKMVDIKDGFPDESRVILTADPAVPYDVLVRTMDAVREDGPRKLFYDVVLGAI